MNEQDTPPLLDNDQLQMLVEAGGSGPDDLFREILDLYLEESSVKLSEIRMHRDGGEVDLLGRAAHALAGSSANIGGLRVWHISKDLEKACREGNREEAMNLVRELEAAYSRTVEVLKDYPASST